MPPLDLVVDLFVRLVLPSGLVGAVLAGLAARFARGAWGSVGLAVATAAGLAVGNYFRDLLPWKPDGAGWPWLLPAALFTLAIAAILKSLAGYRKTQLALMAVVAVLATVCLVPEDLRSAPWLVGFGLLVLGNTFLLDRSMQQKQSGLILLAWAALLAGGAGTVLIFAHSARFSDTAMMLGATLAGVAVPTWWWQRDTSVLAAPLAVFLPGLLISGYDSTYSEVPAASFALTAAAPLALACLPPFKRLSAWKQWGLQVGLVAIPVIAAVALAQWFDDLGTGY